MNKRMKGPTRRGKGRIKRAGSSYNAQASLTAEDDLALDVQEEGGSHPSLVSHWLEQRMQSSRRPGLCLQRTFQPHRSYVERADRETRVAEHCGEC